MQRLERFLEDGGVKLPVILQGAEMLGWELDELLNETLEAMKTCEEPQ